MERTQYTKNRRSHSHSGKDKWRFGICTVLAFLLSLAFVGIAVLVVIKTSCFSRGAVFNNMVGANYYKYVTEDIKENAEAITLPTGLSVDVLQDAIQQDDVYKNVKGYINASFTGEAYTADTAELREILDKNVRQYLTSEGITPNLEQDANIDVYIDSIEQIYTDAVQMPLLSVYTKARNIYNKVFPIGIAACAVWIVFILILILKLYSPITRSLSFVIYSTMSAGLMIVIVPVAILVSGFYKRIHLAPEYFYNFAMMFISNMLQTFLYFGLGFGIVSVIMFLAIQTKEKD